MPEKAAPLSIAPMMGYTNRYFRALLRLISPDALLYSEMITAAALVRRDPVYISRLLDFFPMEHPVALQLGGSDPKELAVAARLGEDWGYDEINLNVGCPSSRVQAGYFGACLMKDPDLVADCVSAMRAAVSVPVTVKTRIGVDNQDSYEELVHFVRTCANAGCGVFIIHARKAWLKGLNPRQNRSIPPLHYDTVYRLASEFPDLSFAINGGIQTTEDVITHLKSVDGVMIGRAACSNPLWIGELSEQLSQRVGRGFQVPPLPEVIEGFLPILEMGMKEGAPMAKLAGGLVGLCRGLPGARQMRKRLFEPGVTSAEVIGGLRCLIKKLSDRELLDESVV